VRAVGYFGKVEFSSVKTASVADTGSLARVGYAYNVDPTSMPRSMPWP